VPKRTLDFNSVASGNTEDLVVAQGIDISQWREASLMMRVHVNSVSAGGGIQIFAQVEGRTAEDPGILFFTSGQTLGILSVTSALTAPYYTVNSLGSGHRLDDQDRSARKSHQYGVGRCGHECRPLSEEAPEGPQWPGHFSPILPKRVFEFSSLSPARR